MTRRINTALISEILIRSVLELILRDIFLIRQKVKEESINHRLAIYIERYLEQYIADSRYHVDVEYNKCYTDPKRVVTDKGEIEIRPDILVHKRNGPKDNLLVIEAKKGYSTKHDRDKMKNLLEKPYSYTSTALVSYLPDRPHTLIRMNYQDGCGEKIYIQNSDPYIVERITDLQI